MPQDTTDIGRKDDAPLVISPPPTEYKGMDGETDDDLVMPIVAIHQGSNSKVKLGNHPAGTLIDTATLAPITATKFIIVSAFAEYIRWKERVAGVGGGMEYRTRNRDEVPAEDLEWTAAPKEGNSDIPPKCTRYRNFIVLFEGEASVVVLALKTSSKMQNKAGKFLNFVEKQRHAKKLPPGLYSIATVEQQKENLVWHEPIVALVGDASADLVAAAAQWHSIITASDAQPETNADTAQNDDDGDAPF